MDSSCWTYRVGKVQSIFSLMVNKKLFRYSVVPLFRIPRITDSQLAVCDIECVVGFPCSFENVGCSKQL